MILTITTTHSPATDLGYLLRKNPARIQSFDLSFGNAHVIYTEATTTRCSVSLIVDVDPIGLIRNQRGWSAEGGTLERYVNDRPYVASSFLSVALADVYGSALSGTEVKDKPGLVRMALPLCAEIPILPSKGGAELVRKLFEPLGYLVTITQAGLDNQFPAWGNSDYYNVRIEASLPLQQLLSHLYLLIPVLDNNKHYWVSEDEVKKLFRHGEQWLATHPERELIARRYLKHQRSLYTEALAQLSEESDRGSDRKPQIQSEAEDAVERTLRLNDERLNSVVSKLKSLGTQTIIDLGCGEGNLLRLLLKERQFTRIVGMDVSQSALERARDRLNYDDLPVQQKERVKLEQGSLMYRDDRLSGFDAAAVVEVIEHLDAPRLAAFERVLFEFARPSAVILTTPNREFNVKWATLPAGNYRHRDHRFEWSRREFQGWARSVADRFGYAVEFFPIGPDDAVVGAPTQMGVFSR